jgi:radical SAM-linked protein
VRVALEYDVAGALRYLSHQDELRMLARALIRARWPVRFSQGFNPIPRLAVPLPRSVGLAAQAQLALVELSEPRPPAELGASLAAALPDGCRLRRAEPAPAGTPHAQGIEYVLELAPQEARTVARHLPAVLSAEEIVVRRPAAPGKPARRADIRPCLERLELDGLLLRMRVRPVDQRLPRPSELVKILGLPPETCAHRVRRVKADWNWEPAGTGGAPAAPEGYHFGSIREDARS